MLNRKTGSKDSGNASGHYPEQLPEAKEYVYGLLKGRYEKWAEEKLNRK